MKEMGLKAYRFSIDWSRVLPEGFGRVNEKGIEFYNHLIDELVENKIEPYITLYHWELPYEIYKRGGWVNPQIVEWFGAYAKLVAERFSDRVSHFFTLNEPQCFVGLGFLTGEHAPGVKAPLRDTFEMAHNAMKAHGRCFRMGEDGKPQEVCRYEGFPKTATQWPVTPECLQWGPKFLYERYHKPIYITENGLSCHDVISLDGKVHDPNRIDFLARYLRELKKAAEEVEIRGYFQWSFMDNFEWSKGYSDRFGLVYVDYRNQQRIMKDSAFWYKHVIETNGAEL